MGFPVNRPAPAFDFIDILSQYIISMTEPNLNLKDEVIGDSDRFYQHYFTRQHDLLREAVRDFVKKEITPCVEAWAEAEIVPRELYGKFCELGFNAVGYPEEYTGTGGDKFEGIVISEEICRGGTHEIMNEIISKHIL